jgi:release factor glutamine methyltransferase
VDGLDVHRRLAAHGGEWLRPGGVLIVETGRRQAPVDVEIFAAAGFDAHVETDDDLDAVVAQIRESRPAQRRA